VVNVAPRSPRVVDVAIAPDCRAWPTARTDNSQSSMIVNRSAVQNAFNRLSDNSEKELRNALIEIAEVVEDLQNSEASDVAESLIEEVAGSRRRGVLAALWARLQEIAPVVSSLTGSAAVVTSRIA
jgi:hypothetical protein